MLPMTLEEHQRMQQYVEVYRDALSQAITKEFFGGQKEDPETLTMKQKLKSLHDSIPLPNPPIPNPNPKEDSDTQYPYPPRA
jgi:hypothetical protein